MPLELLAAGSDSLHKLSRDDFDLKSLLKVAGDSDIFPPEYYTVVEIASGEDHTLALIELDSAQNKHLNRFTSVGDLVPDAAKLPFKEEHATYKKVACGRKCSYIVFTKKDENDLSEPPANDVLVSLGFHQDNYFGELGCPPPEASSAEPREGGKPCKHLISFAGVLTEAGLDANAQVEILDIAAGLRHAVVGLLVRTGTEGRVIIAGPGPAPGVLEPRLIWDWKTPDPASIRCKVRAGREHTVVLVQGDVDGKTSILRCIGSNEHGQCAGIGDDDASAALLKYGVTPDHIADVTCNWTTTHFLVSRQKGDARTRPLILSCGSNDQGQIGNASRQSTSSEKALVPAATNGGDFYLTTVFSEVEKLVSGSKHSLILGKWHWESSEVKAEKGEKQVWGWGWNEHGNLAQGKKGSRPVHDEPMLLLAPKQICIRRDARHHPVNIWAGHGTSYVLTEVEEVDS
ncbi:uncharacterized protein UBRO_20188 [Ustilago bromivora]|uniref:Uncharacterized protein n=1 Tax=Ustilago bromivora TaxID=307758 RepID=A0A1K0HBG7_9BASI|nr:uncharacterized protein UBRO_20188 [Ustilago bromivora]SYW82730.1 uncharacterized protein UBRO2_04852 [Ustilago bromivora]